MKSLSAVIVFCFGITAVYSQQIETELDRRNGFKDIKLASAIDSVKGAKFKKNFKEKGSHDAQLYLIEHPDYENIGEVNVNQIEAKVYKGLIYQIVVITEKDTRLIRGMEAVLGKPVYNVRDESYNWVGQRATLRFASHSKNELELIYSSPLVVKMMNDDKRKKIKDIAADL